MKIQKIFYAAFVGMTLAVDSALSQFVLTPIPELPNVASGSVAWCDYDNDGRLDFLLSGSLELSLWRNTGAGFTNVTASVAPDLPGLYDGAVAWGDFDNDTRLDLLITGLTNFSGRAEVSQVWRNTGSGFTNVPIIGLPGVAQSSAAWSDFDSDGRLDFLLTGTTNGNSSGAISQLWRNTGDGFTNVQIPALTGVYFGSTAWGDFDNDRRPDFLITGITNGSATDATAQLWRNTGSGFTNMPIPGLRGVFVSSLGWGDYDNDGRLDFLLEGLSANGFLSEVWRNTGDGFINVPVPGLPGIADGSLAWGDYDGDGWLDFLITGLANGATRVSQVWRNTGSGFNNVPVPGLPGNFDNSLAWGDYDNDGRLDFLIAGTIEGGNISQLWRNTVIASNSPPAAPAGLSSIVTGSTVVLTWTPPADDHTPTAGLSYNVRMGTTPGGSDIVSAPALTTGGLLVPRTGTARNGSTEIHSLTPGQTYYWSVQAVDTSFTGSPFAAEQEFSTSAQEVSIPDAGLNAAIREALQKPIGPLAEQDLLGLTILDASSRNISSVEGLEVARNLVSLDLFQNQLTNFTLPNGFGNLVLLDLGFNSLSQCSIPDGLTNLDTLFLEGNLLTSFILPAGLNALTTLDLSGNQLTSFVLPTDMTNLTTALIFANQLTNLTLPANLSHLGNLDLDFNHLRALELPAGLTNLASFVARDNQLTNLTFPPDMTNLTFIDVGGNRLRNLTLPAGLTRLNFLRLPENELNSLTLPPGLTNLASIFLANNQLTNLTLSSDLFHLVQIDLAENKLARLTLPAGMTNLSVLILDGNQLTTLTLPPDLTKLERLTLSGNPLTTLVLSQPSADTRLVGLVASLANEDVSVFTYPLAIGLLKPRQTLDNTFAFILAGPPGIYAVLGSTDLVAWSALGAVTNTLGSIGFTDVAAHLSSQRFYRVHSVR